MSRNYDTSSHNVNTFPRLFRRHAAFRLLSILILGMATSPALVPTLACAAPIRSQPERVRSVRQGPMLMLRRTLEFLVKRRYEVKTIGLDEIRSQGNERILFFSNHPSGSDTYLNELLLLEDFAPRPLMEELYYNTPIIKQLSDQVDALPVYRGHGPSIDRRTAMMKLKKMITEVREGLQARHNFLIYPAGELQTSKLESLSNTGIVDRLLEGDDQTRVVLIRVRGLWGSLFSFARNGRHSPMPVNFLRAAQVLLQNGVFFAPKRPVTLEYVEPKDFPRHGTRDEIKAYLEEFYNDEAPGNTYVPEGWWEGAEPEIRPEPTHTPA